MNNIYKKAIYFSLILFSFSLIFFLFFNIFSYKKEIDFIYKDFEDLNRAEYFLKKEKIEEQSREIILMAVGDIMLNRGVEYMVKKYGEGDYNFPFLKIKEDLDRADILFGNLESVISNKGEKVGSIYSFRAELEAIGGLNFAGFNIVSISNNHSFDYGRLALEDSMNILKENNINYVGGGFNKKEARKGVLIEVKGTKIAFLGYTGVGLENWQAKENISGINWIRENMKEDIIEAKEKSDLVVVSFHFGEEYKEIENDNQRYWSKFAIDNGADLILGHHPHVIQPIENYKEGIIFYSLGNFVFDQYFSKETMEGLLAEIVIEDKKIKEVIPKKFKINEFYQPYFENNL